MDYLTRLLVWRYYLTDTEQALNTFPQLTLGDTGPPPSLRGPRVLPEKSQASSDTLLKHLIKKQLTMSGGSYPGSYTTFGGTICLT